MPTIAEAMAGMTFELQGTGGNCTAYVSEIGEGRTMLITSRDEPKAPICLSEPCDFGTYDADGQPESVYPDDVKQFDTVLACLRDLYGREEGSDWPGYLQDSPCPNPCRECGSCNCGTDGYDDLCAECAA